MPVDPSAAPREPDFDVLVIGAGISGIAAAHRAQSACPDLRIAILERRESIGGTWDLFRYPGVRSDSDMHTLGFPFYPWTGDKSIADGATICVYIRDAADAVGVTPLIRFRHGVTAMSWSTDAARWTVSGVRKGEGDGDGDAFVHTARFVISCTGYYRYDRGHTPDFPGLDTFEGECIHQQLWGDADGAGKNIVIIGSGATAVTLVPALAKTAAHVTMLQRSPSYILSIPARDKAANWVRDRLPQRLGYPMVRWRNIGVATALFGASKRFPKSMRRLLQRGVERGVGPNIDVETHFTPKYDPWDQRLCLVPDGDFFNALREGSASVVTDHIDSFVAEGIRLKSGKTLKADMIVTATGLKLQFLGGISVEMDGKTLEPKALVSYRGMMLGGVPNLSILLGYTNASWTLKADLIAERVARVLSHMTRHRMDICRPEPPAATEKRLPFLNFDAGYVRRAFDLFPSQGARDPWQVHQNYFKDLFTLRFAPLADGTLTFKRAANPSKTPFGRAGSPS